MEWSGSLPGAPSTPVPGELGVKITIRVEDGEDSEEDANEEFLVVDHDDSGEHIEIFDVPNATSRSFSALREDIVKYGMAGSCGCCQGIGR